MPGCRLASVEIVSRRGSRGAGRASGCAAGERRRWRCDCGTWKVRSRYCSRQRFWFAPTRNSWTISRLARLRARIFRLLHPCEACNRAGRTRGSDRMSSAGASTPLRSPMAHGPSFFFLSQSIGPFRIGIPMLPNQVFLFSINALNNSLTPIVRVLGYCVAATPQPATARLLLVGRCGRKG